MGETLDPSSDELSRTDKMGIDATKPLSGFSPKIEIDANAQEAIKRLYQYIK
jgi:3-polyprenyl-4-hydroxybenzoate decarboxylase